MAILTICVDKKITPFLPDIMDECGYYDDVHNSLISTIMLNFVFVNFLFLHVRFRFLCTVRLSCILYIH